MICHKNQPTNQLILLCAQNSLRNSITPSKSERSGKNPPCWFTSLKKPASTANALSVPLQTMFLLKVNCKILVWWSYRCHLPKSNCPTQVTVKNVASCVHNYAHKKVHLKLTLWKKKLIFLLNEIYQGFMNSRAIKTNIIVYYC